MPFGPFLRNGPFMVGVKPEQVRVTDGPAVVRRLELDRGPRRIIILLDASYSMSGTGRNDESWTAALQLARDFVSFVQPGDQLSLHIFADQHRILVPFTSEFALITQAIDSLPRPSTKVAKKSTGHYTRLGQALSEILSEEPSRDRFGDAILLISDGQNAEGEVRPELISPDLIRAGIRLNMLRVGPFVTALGIRVETNKLEDENEKQRALWAETNDMAILSRQTGGIALAPWESAQVRPSGEVMPLSPEYLKAVVKLSYAFCHSFYRMEVEVTSPPKKPRKLSLELLSEKGKPMKNTQLFYPRFLPTPANNP